MVIILIAVATLITTIHLPLSEGRARHLDWLSIYLDPFILYGYAASIAFFVALCKAFRLLGYIRQNKAFSQGSLKAARDIKYCAILLILMAGIYIRIFHNRDDDTGGFLAICTVTAFVSVAAAITAARFEKRVQKAIDMKSSNLP